jgi:hypothetical protein
MFLLLLEHPSTSNAQSSIVNVRAVAYECDEGMERLAKSKAYRVDEFIYICVEPNTQTQLQDIRLRYVEDFGFYMANSAVTEQIVEDRVVVNDKNTFVTCVPGSPKCLIKTKVRPEFHFDVTPTGSTITGLGEVSMVHTYPVLDEGGGGSRRTLQETASDPYNDYAGSSDFKLSLEIQYADPSTVETTAADDEDDTMLDGFTTDDVISWWDSLPYWAQILICVGVAVVVASCLCCCFMVLCFRRLFPKRQRDITTTTIITQPPPNQFSNNNNNVNNNRPVVIMPFLNYTPDSESQIMSQTQTTDDEEEEEEKDGIFFDDQGRAYYNKPPSPTAQSGLGLFNGHNSFTSGNQFSHYSDFQEESTEFEVINPADVCFGCKHKHPGTKDFFKVCKRAVDEFHFEEYNVNVRKHIKSQLQNRKYYKWITNPDDETQGEWQAMTANQVNIKIKKTYNKKREAALGGNRSLSTIGSARSIGGRKTLQQPSSTRSNTSNTTTGTPRGGKKPSSTRSDTPREII